MVVASEVVMVVFAVTWVMPLFLKVRMIWRLIISKPGVVIEKDDFFFLIRRATLFHSQKFELEDFLVLVEEGKVDELHLQAVQTQLLRPSGYWPGCIRRYYDHSKCTYYVFRNTLRILSTHKMWFYWQRI